MGPKIAVGRTHEGDLHDYPDLEIADFVEAALEIGRAVGCSAYEDDFVRPDFPEKWTRHSWTSFPATPPADP